MKTARVRWSDDVSATSRHAWAYCRYSVRFVNEPIPPLASQRNKNDAGSRAELRNRKKVSRKGRCASEKPVIPSLCKNYIWMRNQITACAFGQMSGVCGFAYISVEWVLRRAP